LKAFDQEAELISCSPCRSLLPVSKSGYDILLLSDLVWLNSLHSALVQSIISLLSRQGGQALIFAGVYTPAACINSFFGLLTEEATACSQTGTTSPAPRTELKWKELDLGDEWLGSTDIEGLYIGEGEEDPHAEEWKREEAVKQWMLSRKQRTRGFLAWWESTS